MDKATREIVLGTPANIVSFPRRRNRLHLSMWIKSSRRSIGSMIVWKISACPAGSSGNLVASIRHHFELAAVEQDAKPVAGEVPKAASG